MTPVSEVLREAAGLLKDAGVGTPSRDARRLLAHVLGTDMAGLTMMRSDPVSENARSDFEKLVERRVQRQPVSHLVGYRDFWKSRFRITADVLDPRPETELLVSLGLEEPFERVLDLGTGSGAIVISLLLENRKATGVGTDISPEALLVAGENADRLGVADRIVLPLSDWFGDIGGRYDLILSNPPYIAADEMPALDPEVRDHEPRKALTDDADGLTAYRAISARARDHLAPGGRVLVEIGPDQGESVTTFFRSAGFATVILHRDLDGRDRVIEARNTP